MGRLSESTLGMHVRGHVFFRLGSDKFVSGREGTKQTAEMRIHFINLFSFKYNVTQIFLPNSEKIRFVCSYD